MRLSIYDLFTVNVVRPDGGWSKGSPIALIEEGDKCVPMFDLLIPNDLDDEELALFVSDSFAAFARPGKRVVRLDDCPSPRCGEARSRGKTMERCTPRNRGRAALRELVPAPQTCRADLARSWHRAGVR
jgi:hypothetical protein